MGKEHFYEKVSAFLRFAGFSRRIADGLCLCGHGAEGAVKGAGEKCPGGAILPRSFGKGGLSGTHLWLRRRGDTYSGLDWSYSEEEIAALDSELLDALRAAVPEGWHACTAQGTNGAPMWGDLIGSDAGGVRLHSFRYHGVPDTYRIILVTKSGESWVSGVLHRATLQSSATVDWAARTANAPSPAMAYALQFLCTLLPTLLIEGLLLFVFGYRSKRSWLVFLLVNLVTQGGFAVYLAVTVLNHGVSGWSLIFYIPIEVIITLVELLLYRRLLTEKNKARAAVYAIAANLCSAVFGLWLIDPLWHFIVSIS